VKHTNTTTPELQETLQRFGQACKDDDRVVAAFVGGSVAKGSADRWSDLDLYAIIADKCYDCFFAERQDFICHLGTPVYLDDFDGFGFDLILFVLSNGVKGELGLGTPSQFLHIHGGPYEVLIDRTGLLENAQFPLLETTTEEQAYALTRNLNTFWRDIHLFCAAIGRSRLESAAEYLNQARSELLRVARLATSTDDTGRLPASVAECYGRTFFHLDEAELLEAALNSANMLSRLGQAVAAQYGTEYPHAFEEVVRHQLGEFVREHI